MHPGFYRILTPEEEAEMRAWARDHYEAGDPISDLWHPITQHEAAVMLLEAYRRQVELDTATGRAEP